MIFANMNEFSFQNELKNIVDSRQLVEMVLDGEPDYRVVYFLSADENFVTFAEINSAAGYVGVSICRMADITSISVDTIYLSELTKQIQGDSLYLQAKKAVESIETFTPSGFISALEDTKTVVELTTHARESIAGRIVGHDDTVLVLDEYSSESDRRIARTYFRFPEIVRIAVDVPWLRTISQSLLNKNL